MTQLPEFTFASDTELRDARFADKLATRRRRMLRWSLPVVILAGLVVVKLLSAVGLNLVGTKSFEDSNYITAAERYHNTQFANWVEPWKAHFNEGTAHYAQGKFFTAGQRLAVALDKVPKAPEEEPRGPEECAVRVNYSLALEGTADESMSLGDVAMAEQYYTQALDMLADCGSSGAGGDEASDAQERQEQSQQDARDQLEEQAGGEEDGEPSEPEAGEPDPSENESGDPEDPDASPEPTPGTDESTDPQEEPTTDPKQEELEERNNEANRTDEDEQTGAGTGSGQNW